MALKPASIRPVQLDNAKDMPRLNKWLQDLRSFLNARGSTEEVNSIRLLVQHEEPRPLQAGLLARTDGLSWDPSGFNTPGVFYYDGSTWSKAF